MKTVSCYMLWCTFNSLLNRCTRCEFAAVIVAMIPGVPMHIWIDKLAVVKKGHAIVDHIQGRAEATLHGTTGQLILVGKDPMCP